MFDIKDIILVILVIIVIYLLYKTRNVENFDIVTDVNTAINDLFKADISYIRNLGEVTKEIINNETSLTLPDNTRVVKKLHIGGNLLINGDVKFSNKNTDILEIFPTFMVIAWAPFIPNTIPKGWALCDGNSYILNSDGTVSVSSSSSSIKTPDLRGRFVLGAGQGTSLSNRNFNNKGGEEKVRLTLDQMPRHIHSAPFIGNNGTGNYNHFYNNNLFAHDYFNDNNFTSNAGGNLDGSTQPHENMPPFHVLYYIMKL